MSNSTSSVGPSIPETLDKPSIEEFDAEEARRYFASWCRLVDSSYQTPAHIRKLIEALEAVERGDCRRLVISIPPRHGKSLTTTIRFPAWFLGRHPDARIICASHTASLAYSFSRRCRNEFAEYGVKVFGVGLAGDSAAVDKWEIAERRGGLLASGVGGPITGAGADCLVAGTLIATENGDVPIELIALNPDAYRVWTYNHQTKAVELRKVEASRSIISKSTLTIVTGSGVELTCTNDHRLFSGGNYTKAFELKPGDELVWVGLCAMQGQKRADLHGVLPETSAQISRDSVAMVGRSREGPILVYDIQVEGNRNFFANGILVHNCLIIDDPIKDAESANSAAQRRGILEWYQTVARPRLHPGAAAILVMTRWHEADLAGELLGKKDGEHWDSLLFPMVDESGSILWPERYSADEVENIHKAVGTRAWESLYQQRPMPLEGGLLKRHWWKFYEEAPTCDMQIQSWDMSFKGGASSDFVVGQVWGRNSGMYYLLDQARGRWDFSETCRRLESMSQKWPHATLKLVEDKANGPAVISHLNGVVSGLVAIEPLGGKESRASAISPLVEAGNVWLPKHATWLEDFLLEATSFPNGKNDDQVDAMSQALNRLRMSTSYVPKLKGKSNYMEAQQ